MTPILEFAAFILATSGLIGGVLAWLEYACAKEYPRNK